MRVPVDAYVSQPVAAAVRALATALKTLRLYPPASPIPRGAVEAALTALRAASASDPALELVVARDGFTHQGAAVAAVGAADLVDLLSAHGVAVVAFSPGCALEELAGFLDLVLQDPESVRASGGIATALLAAGVHSIRVSEVVLNAQVAETLEPEDLDDFLRELAADPNRLATWLSSAVKGDPAALADALLELSRAAGPLGAERLARALGVAFLAQEQPGKDTLVGLALGNGEVAPLLHKVLLSLRPPDLASALTGGLYGSNMLSLSHVLTALPFGPRLDEMLAEVKPLLVEAGRDERELDFLDHMIQVRSQAASEPPLAEAAGEYRTVASLGSVPDADLDRARSEITSSAGTVSARAVRTMLMLLDQQQDFDLWCRTLASLASAVPALFEQRQFSLAERVLTDIATREARTTRPWPGVAEQVRRAMDRATSEQAMAALLDGVLSDPLAAGTAHEILRRAGDAAQQRLVLAALRSRSERALDGVENLLGPRLVDVLVALAPHVEPACVAQLAQRLSGERTPRPRQALEALLRRPDAASRIEAVRGLGRSESPDALGLLVTLASDPSREVAVAAVRAIAESPAPGAAVALGTVFDAIDADGADFPIAREVLGGLARTKDAGAAAVLARIASRRAFIKRGHFGEVQTLAERALAIRSGEEPRT